MWKGEVVLASLGPAGLTRSRSWAPDPLTSEEADDALRPRMQGLLSGPVQRRLSLAYPMAMRRLEENQGCGALFGPLGKDGPAILGSTIYHALDQPNRYAACRNGAVAFVVPQLHETFVCTAFAWMSNDLAAAVLIHEALHMAGLDESPRDPKGLTSPQITTLVRERCGL